MENVPQVHSKKNIDNFEKWQNFLTSLGYKNYWQDLNAKDYGIPQNRNRCFMISILNSEDIYSFPEKEELKLRLKDMLEEEVEEKYYLSDIMIDYIVANNEKWTGNNNKSLANKSIASTINTNEGNRRCDASNYIVKGLPENIDLKCIGSLKGSGLPWDKMYNQLCKVYNSDGCSPTIDTMQGGNEPPLYTNYKKLVETVEQNELPIGEVKHMDLYNRNLTDNCGTLTDPCHNNNRLWDGLRIRNLHLKNVLDLWALVMKILIEQVNLIHPLNFTNKLEIVLL